MSLEDALDAYTWGSAHAEFAENWKGRLLPGYVADLIVLDRDIFALPPEALLEVPGRNDHGGRQNCLSKDRLNKMRGE